MLVTSLVPDQLDGTRVSQRLRAEFKCLLNKQEVRLPLSQSMAGCEGGPPTLLYRAHRFPPPTPDSLTTPEPQVDHRSFPPPLGSGPGRDPRADMLSASPLASSHQRPFGHLAAADGRPAAVQVSVSAEPPVRKEQRVNGPEVGTHLRA